VKINQFRVWKNI